MATLKTERTSKLNEIKIFNNSEFGEIRTVTIDGEPYFVGKDVATVLGYSNPNEAIQDHVDVEDKLNSKTLSSFEINLGQRGGWLINESGLYCLILESELDSAKRFKKWVTKEILPTIRKTGGYVNSDDLFLETYFPFIDDESKVLFTQTLSKVREQNEIIKKQNAEIKHKEDVIIGLVDDIDLATKRQRITQIVRYGAKQNYQERYALLYSEFDKKYHCNVKQRMKNDDTLKPKAKNTMDYIDRGMHMIPQLYEIACKLFENDVEKIKAEWEITIS